MQSLLTALRRFFSARKTIGDEVPPPKVPVGNELDLEALTDHIKEYEGTGPRDELGRFHLYEDSVFETSIGFGHNLLANGLDEDVVEHQLRNDIDGAISDCNRLDYWDSLSGIRKLVVADLAFNLGATRWAKFVKANAALRQGDYALAARELENSKWFYQVGRRGRRLVRLMSTNEWTP